MVEVNRRSFLQAAAASCAAAGFMQQAAARTPAFGPDDPFDVVVRGGDVVDPSQGLRGRRDIGIRNGLVVSVEPEIAAARGRRSIDAAGKLVLPGLVDFHAHVYQGSGVGLSGDELVPLSGTTTYVSAGDAGAGSFPAFRSSVIAQSRTRILAFLHISAIGLTGAPHHEMLDIEYARVDAAARMLAEHPDVLIGIKVRQTAMVVGQNGLEPLKRAIAATERSGVEGSRVMCHIGAVPGTLAELLDLMRPGDVVTHAYSGVGNNIVADGKVLDAAIAAKKRGVLIDVGHGGGSFDYTVCEAALQQGLLPDIISSDIHVFSINTPGKPFMPWVMSKFLNLGVPLEQVVAMATVNPAKAINRVPKLGTLQLGAPADISIMEMVEGPVEFVDTRRNTRKGDRYLKPVQTMKAGRLFGGV